MSPVFKWQNWSMPLPQVAALVFFGISGWIAFDKINDRLASIEGRQVEAQAIYISAYQFDRWQHFTEKLNSNWAGADMETIRE